jgi:hypothetical protein
MPKPLVAAAVVVLIGLFFIANRGAYEGYFSDDDLDNIAWTRHTPVEGYLIGLATPQYYPQNFRPVGHFSFHVLGKTAKLDYRWYVAFIQVLHFAVTFLVWRLLRRLDFGVLAAAAGAVFFLFHMGLFEALWKPMFLFDLWCALFCLLSVLSWLNRRWVVSFIFFWLAYKSKEHAAMLPAVLAAYEYWLGERNWKRLAPFFAVSAMFGLQAVFSNKEVGRDYNLSLAPESLLSTLGFYTHKVLVFPWLGLALLPAPFLVRDRRMWFGLAGCLLLLAPLLALPNRTFGAYLYAPAALLAVGFAAAAARLHWGVAAAFFALWLPANYLVLRQGRKDVIARAHENRAYVERARTLPREMPEMRRFVYDGHPPEMRQWGIGGTLQYFYNAEVEVHSVEEKNLSQMFRSGGVALLSWDNVSRKLEVISRAPGETELSYLTMSRMMPVWQLEEGWYQLENAYRWIKPRASANLFRPAGVVGFELHVNAGPQYMQAVKRARVEIRLDGVSAGAVEFEREGWQKARIAVPPGPAGSVRVEFQVQPEFRPAATDPRALGIPVAGFGFVQEERR